LHPEDEEGKKVKVLP